MKKSLLLPAFIALVVAACSTEPHYVVNGKIDGSDSIKFLLQKRIDGKMVTIDSAVAHKGTFRMKGGSVKYPEMVLLTAANTRLRTQFYLENANITITGHIDSLFAARVTGSKTQDEYNGFVEANKVLSDKYSDIYTRYQAADQRGDAEAVAQLEKEAEAVETEMTDLQKNFVKNNPSSFAAPAILTSLSYGLEGDEIESYINAMDTAVANTEIARNLKERAVKMKKVAVGQKAPDFTMNDPEGNPISLYSKLGPKLVLLDFWAAWCGPCRRENPNVVKVYKDFHKKGFDVFGVSLDQKRDDWVKAISDDNLTWTHVSDLQYWNNSAAQLYAVSAIPSNFLLDENGTIIGRNLRGEELAAKVKEVLGN